VNGAAGVVVFANGRPYAVIGLAFGPTGITEVDFLVDPERLARLDLSAVGP
jgi:RNA polymerase sigma-70 factor (ECF subfamily)